MYRVYGYYLEGVKNLTFKGLDGMDKMKQIMSGLRSRPVSSIGGLAVKHVEDYLTRKRTAADGTVSDIELPAGDAVKLLLDNSAWICIRPPVRNRKSRFITWCVKSRGKRRKTR